MQAQRHTSQTSPLGAGRQAMLNIVGTIPLARRTAAVCDIIRISAGSFTRHLLPPGEWKRIGSGLPISAVTSVYQLKDDMEKGHLDAKNCCMSSAQMLRDNERWRAVPRYGDARFMSRHTGLDGRARNQLLQSNRLTDHHKIVIKTHSPSETAKEI